MYDEGLINFEEPFTTLRNHGMILAPDGLKMSKSKGNTIEPEGLIEQGYGADSIRIMELFIGPWDQSANWSVEGMGGSFRFLQRAWTLVQEYLQADAPKTQGNETAVAQQLLKINHRTVKKVSQDLQAMGFNTAIASLMELVNQLYRIKAEDSYVARAAWKDSLQIMVQLMAPFAPHISEEMWRQLGNDTSVHVSTWPSWDEQYLTEDSMTIAVQVNGKVRAELTVAHAASKDDIVAAAKAHERVRPYLEGKDIQKTIYVPSKLVSFVA
jgi:leucyl-tRNA synthetase